MSVGQPWERQESESTPAWAAFQSYRDMGFRRSTARVAQDLGKSKRLMDQWSSQHKWVSRCRSWDEHLDAEGRRAQEEAVREMSDRHARLSVAVLNRVGQRLLGDPDNEIQPLDINSLSPQDLIRWFVEAVKVERLARGLSTANVTQSHSAEIEVAAEADQLEHEPDRLARLAELAHRYGLFGPNLGGADGDGEGRDNEEPVAGEAEATREFERLVA